MTKKIFLLLLLPFFAACARHHDGEVFLPGSECPKLYVLLPENYIIDLAAGSRVSLNPAFHEFIVFCSPEEAMRMREKGIRQGLLQSNQRWVVYELEGNPAELASWRHGTTLCLKNSALVQDWIKEGE